MSANYGDQKRFCTLTAVAADFTKDDLLAQRTISFARDAFLVDGRLPHPAV